MRKSYKHILSSLKYDKYEKNFIAKGNHKARQKAKKFLKKTHNKLKRLNEKLEILKNGMRNE